MNRTLASQTESVKLGSYSLVRSLAPARGGVETFQASDASGRTVVVRVMEKAACGPLGVPGLMEPLRRLEKVQDARLLRPLNSGEGQLRGKDVVYFVMPMVEGAPLSELMEPEGGALLPAEMCALGVQLAEALAAAHAVGVSHGNVCPANVFLVPGRKVVLTDLGLSPVPTLTLGSVRQFPAPELRLGGPATPAGDVFALTLCVAASACGTNALRKWQSAIPGTEAGLVLPALESVGQVPAELGRILAGALHPDHAARPTAAALANALRPHATALPEIAQASDGNAGGFGATGELAETQKVNVIDEWLGPRSDPTASPLPADGKAAATTAPTTTPSFGQPVTDPDRPSANAVFGKPPTEVAPSPTPGFGKPPTEVVASPVVVKAAAAASTPAPSFGQPITVPEPPAMPPPGPAAHLQPPPVPPPSIPPPSSPPVTPSFTEVLTEPEVIAATSASGPPPPPPPTPAFGSPIPPSSRTSETTPVLQEAPAPRRQAHGVPTLSVGERGAVTLNLSVPALPTASPQDFPLVARWTERTGNKGQGPVEYVQPKGRATPAPSTGRPVVPLGLGFVLGFLLGAAFIKAAGGGSSLPPPGTLRVESTAEDQVVDVELDGRAVGKAPVTLEQLPAGSHVVVMRSEGAEPTVITASVEGGRETVVRGAPELTSSRLVVTAPGKDGTVALGDEKPRKLPAEYDDLEPGAEVELNFRIAGQAFTRTVRIPAGELQIHFDVARAPGAKPTEAPPAPAPETPPPPA
ncbi:MAG: PEGA domain-containing protein, partial [Myxococcota bacterium]